MKHPHSAESRDKDAAIANLFERLPYSQNAQQYADVCSDLVKLSKWMTDGEILDLANAVKIVFPKGARRRPPLVARHEAIMDLLQTGPKLGKFHGVRPADAIKVIMTTYKMTEATARKAYEKANKSCEEYICKVKK